MPLALRGAVDVTTYAPSALPPADQDLMLRVDQLYAKARSCTPCGPRHSTRETWLAMHGEVSGAMIPPRSAARPPASWRARTGHESR